MFGALAVTKVCQDSVGSPLVGEKNYKLNLPPNIPAENFWSVTLYEAENASGPANGQPFPSLGSRDKPAQNADGSTDLYLGPKAPDGKAGNWLATVPGRGYLAILRLYSPTTSNRQELETGRHRKSSVISVRASVPIKGRMK